MSFDTFVIFPCCCDKKQTIKSWKNRERFPSKCRSDTWHENIALHFMFSSVHLCVDAVLLCRAEVEQLKAENAQQLLQLSQDKMDIAQLNKWCVIVTSILLFFCIRCCDYGTSLGAQERWKTMVPMHALPWGLHRTVCRHHNNMIWYLIRSKTHHIETI